MTRSFLILLVICTLPAFIYSQDDGSPVTILESGWSVVPANNGFKFNIALVLINPYREKFAHYPQVKVALKARNGSILKVLTLNGAGIVPGGKIAICQTVRVEESPTSAQIYPLSAQYENTIYRPSDFKEFSISNQQGRLDKYGSDMIITGEISNPYGVRTGVWVAYLQRNKDGTLIGGHSSWQDTVLAIEATPFETRIPVDEIFSNTAKVESMVFSHNNEQSSWHKIFRK